MEGQRSDKFLIQSYENFLYFLQETQKTDNIFKFFFFGLFLQKR